MTCRLCVSISWFFFFNDTATTEIYTLSLHDALPIWSNSLSLNYKYCPELKIVLHKDRSEEHTSELQSQSNLVCRLLLEKKQSMTSQATRRTFCVRIAWWWVASE